MAFKRRLKFDKRIRFQKQMSIMYILLFVVLASLGVGYAYIKSNLNINGTANVTAARWDVHFTNLNVTTGSVTATTPANITDDTTVEFAATLDEPGDYYEFTVDVVNNGTMDAMIDNFSISPQLTTAQKKYLDYIIVYSDGIELENKQELKANTSETLIVRFMYKKNDNTSNYPVEDQSFTISLSMNYVQSNNDSEAVRNYLYRSNGYNLQNGDSTLTTNYYCIYEKSNDYEVGCYTSREQCQNHIYIASEQECRSKSVDSSSVFYNTPASATSSIGTGVFIRHNVKNNLISNSSIGYAYNGNTYYLVGGGATYNSDLGIYNGDSIFYEQNKEVLNGLFGKDKCNELYDSVNEYYDYYCSDNSNKRARVVSEGQAWLLDGPLGVGWECLISSDSSSFCEESRLG